MGTAKLRLCTVLLLGLYGGVWGHGKPKRSSNQAGGGASIEQVGVFVLPPPTGAPLSPLCVEKYAMDLLLPPPMPRNTAPTGRGPGCYNFSKIRPPNCPSYGSYGGPDHSSYYPRQERPYGSRGPYPWVDPDGKPYHPRDTPGYADAVAWDADEAPQQGSTKEAGMRAEGLDSAEGRAEDGAEGLSEVEVSKYGHGKRKHHDVDYKYDSAEEDPFYGRGYEDEEDYEGRHKKHKKDHGHKKHSHYGDYDRDDYPKHHDYPKPPSPPGCNVHKFDEYQISVKKITQRSLPPGPFAGAPADENCPATFNLTTVLAYGPTNGAQFNWPAFTIEAQRYHPVRVQWSNELVDPITGNYQQHPLSYAIDQTLHWANPEALGGSIDDSPCHMCMNNCTDTNPGCTKAATTEYTGPVPIVTHVHGMEDVRDHSDGYTEAWYLPNAKNIAPNYTAVGTWYGQFEREYNKETCQWYAKDGAADYIYPVTQRPATSWYHDHVLGLTRLNVYAGMAGFFFIRSFFPTFSPKNTGPELPGLPYPPPGGAVNPGDIRELPLAIQDRLFDSDGSLWYPVTNLPSPDLAYPVGVQPPKWLPEFPFAPDVDDQVMMTVNGRVWPKTAIAPDTYRLRLLNGCNARALTVQFGRTTTGVTNFNYTDTTSFTPVQFWVIGNEAGWFPQIQGPVSSLTMGPAERYDVIVDFSGMSAADFVYMYNSGPEQPYTNGVNQTEFANQHTSQLLRFQFNASLSGRPATAFNSTRQAVLNAALAKEAPVPLPPSTRPVKQLALIEEMNPTDPGVVKAVLLGTVVNSTGIPQFWSGSHKTSTPTNAVEEWDIINLTADAHPIHVHEFVYETIERTLIEVDPADDRKFNDTGIPVASSQLDPMLFLQCPTGTCRAQRDVSLLLPGTRTRLRFWTGNTPGLFVWHCHIVEHEDNEMMLPMCIGQPGYANPKNASQLFCPTPV